MEQEEYVKEGIDWVMVDFGMDLAAAIIMFEKPMGIWAILEEESLFPKATDKSFEEKLKASLGKLPVFLKPQSKTDKNAHFAISHYAGIVSYNVTGWLEKNKDPVNDTVVEVMKSTSGCILVSANKNLTFHRIQITIPQLVQLWEDHPGQPTTTPKEEGKKKKKGGGKTVSSVYLVSLTELMVKTSCFEYLHLSFQTTLHTCEPHFVRCLVPNTHKKPGEVKISLQINRLISFSGGSSPDHAPAHVQRCPRGDQDCHARLPKQVKMEALLSSSLSLSSISPSSKLPCAASQTGENAIANVIDIVTIIVFIFTIIQIAMCDFPTIENAIANVIDTITIIVFIFTITQLQCATCPTGASIPTSSNVFPSLVKRRSFHHPTIRWLCSSSPLSPSPFIILTRWPFSIIIITIIIFKKVAVHALLDKVNFSRDRYRLGHTVIFYRSVKIVTWICQSCCMYLSKLLHVFVKVVTCTCYHLQGGSSRLSGRDQR